MGLKTRATTKSAPRVCSNNHHPSFSLLVTKTAVIIGTAAITLLLLPLGIANVWAANYFGTPGADTIVGTPGDDNIFGQEGNDNLSGQEGDDYIEGHLGNDVINDGLGNDNIWAGNGDDRINLEGNGGNATFGFDEVHGERGRDIIDGFGSGLGFLSIYGGPSNDNITTGGDDNRGRMQGGTGDDYISTCCDANYDAWGGPGNDLISGSSECSLNVAIGGGGNDRIEFAGSLTRGGSGNDVIEFYDCGGIAYGDRGNDEMRAGDYGTELHGGSEDDILVGNDGEDDQLFGDEGNDTLTGGGGADSFSCGLGTDTITDFNAAEGDSKTPDCERF
jgi:Ca2+-binding RTX toxin-like protein